jgi:hypothetical protein
MRGRLRHIQVPAEVAAAMSHAGGAGLEEDLERLADCGNLTAGSSGISLFSITEYGSVILNTWRL